MGDIIFNSSEVLSFNSKEECLEKVNELLSDPERRELMAFRLQAKILSLYEDRVVMRKIRLLLEEFVRNKPLSGDSGAVGLPSWYVEKMYYENLYKNFLECALGNCARDSYFFYIGYGFNRNLLASLTFIGIVSLSATRLILKKISKFISIDG